MRHLAEIQAVIFFEQRSPAVMKKVSKHLKSREHVDVFDTRSNEINHLIPSSSTHFQAVRYFTRSVADTPVCIAGEMEPVIAWNALMQAIHAGLRRKWSSSRLKYGGTCVCRTQPGMASLAKSLGVKFHVAAEGPELRGKTTERGTSCAIIKFN